MENFGIYISYVGYQDTYLSIKNTDKKDLDLGSIVMYADSSKVLNEVTVFAHSTIENINKTIVFPSSQQLKASTSSLDLLQQLRLPGLYVDPIQLNIVKTL